MVRKMETAREMKLGSEMEMAREMEIRGDIEMEREENGDLREIEIER